MADVWQKAVKGNNAAKLAELVTLSAASPEAALALVRGCGALLELEQAGSSTTTAAAAAAAAAAPPSTSNRKNAEASSEHGHPLLYTMKGVQLLHPRGRFNLEFRKSGVTITGKAATLNISWDNVRHIIRLPRPEGFNWGRTLDQNDPAGSDLLALPLKAPVPLRKSEATLVLLQPDPKASHAEVCIPLDGATHKVSGSQGTVVTSLLKLLCGVKLSVPDKGLFVNRGGKSFVKCYFGVNEGSLFPLKQGLFFMKPALFLPKGDIEEVVCGRGGSATTRYVDLVVGMEAGEDEKQTTREFSNIEREDLPSLQSYIQDALVAPRLREAKKAAKAEAAATAATPSPVPVQPETARPTATSGKPAKVSGESTAASSGQKTSPSKRAGCVGRETSAERRERGTGGSAEGAVNGTNQAEKEEDEEDDGDAESDEDFAPVAGDTDDEDDSGSSVSSASEGSDNDSDSDSEKEEGDEDKHEEKEAEGEENAEKKKQVEDKKEKKHAGAGGGKEGDAIVSEKPAEKRKRLCEREADRPESLQLKNTDNGDNGGDDTESDEEGRKKKRAT